MRIFFIIFLHITTKRLIKLENVIMPHYHLKAFSLFSLIHSIFTSFLQCNKEVSYKAETEVQINSERLNFPSKHTYSISLVFCRLIQPMTPQSTVASKPSQPPLPSIDVRHFAMNEAVIALRTKIGLSAKSIT